MGLPAVIRRYRRKRQAKIDKANFLVLKQIIFDSTMHMDPNTIDVAFRVEGETEFREPQKCLPAPIYWLSKSGVRHNSYCGWFKTCAGREVRFPDGEPCKLCGG